ncbi:MAG TPA: transporter substrate-binding domain-containing protein [Thermodesulfobacteriota bacterium]|nr:transporter substrate-binding domain-containing protein [Thermodesulfobacteriota bacterium]
MKRITSLLLLFVFCFLSQVFSVEGIAGTLQDVKKRGKLIVGVKTDYPPFGFLDKKGVNKGFDIDIAKALAKELFGNEEAIQFMPVTSGNRIAFLTSKKIDVIVATLTITEEREKQVDFSAPYFITAQLILVRDDSKITKYEDLAGKKVATIRGSTGDIAIEELVPTAERIEFERNFEALQALKDRRVEAFVEDFVLLFNLLQKNRGLKMASLQPFRPARYGLAVRKGDKEWLDFVNTTLAKMKETGEYEKLLEKWFGLEAKALWRLFKQ